MTLQDALRLIAVKSPNNTQNATRALRTAQNRPNARPVQYVLEQALIDPLATFTAEERAGIAALIGSDDTRSRVLQVRVTADEMAQVQQAADEAGQTVSDFIRSRIGL